MSQSDVLQDDAEIRRALTERGGHLVAHLRAHGEQLLSLVLGHSRLENLVADGRQDALVVVRTSGHVDLRELIHVGAEQEPQGEVHLLQILGSGDGRDGPGPGAKVVDGGVLDERDQEVGALQRRLGQDTPEAVEHHRRGASVDCGITGKVGNGSRSEIGAGGGWSGVSGDYLAIFPRRRRRVEDHAI